MTPQETELYARIEAFQFDEGTPEMSFAARLAQDNGWHRFYALRVVAEYRRFLFLMLSSRYLTVPSDQVDQAWHQHLQYTRSWAEFCARVSLQQIHHEPTRGGVCESNRFKASYQRTLKRYRGHFGEPPEDIWPAASLRFGRDLHYRRINTATHMVIPRSWLLWSGLAAAAVFGAVFLFWVS